MKDAVHISIVFNPKGRTDRNGRSKICICVNHKGEGRKYYDCGLSVEKKYFDKDKGRIKENRSTPPEYANYNNIILKKWQEYEGAKAQILQTYGYFSFAKLDALINRPKTNNLFAFIDEFCRLVDNKRAWGTIQNYRSTKMHLKNFRQIIYIQDIDLKFLQEFEHYLRTQVSPNTAVKYMKNLQVFIESACKQKLMSRAENPFYDYDMPRQIFDRNNAFLSSEEVEKIKQCKMRTEGQEIAKNVFLFACYSGLRFSDVIGLTPEKIEGEGKKTIISFCAEKTDTPQRIPIGKMWEDSVLILNKYKEEHDKKLFKISNQYCNRVLKEIAKQCGIKKELSHRMARHTFATSLINHGMPMHYVQKLLGHKSIRTTEIYAVCTELGLNEAINKVFENWEQ